MHVKACGIDAGSESWAIASAVDGKLEKYTEVSTKKIVENPHEIIDAVNTLGTFDAVSAPSGYGLPLKKLGELSEKDFEELLLKKKSEGGKAVVGLEKVLREMKKRGLNAFVLPGVKHLPTVPSYRKINRIDLGTPDKVCACAAAIEDYCAGEGMEYGDASFLFAEVGSAFNAFLAVDSGKIVDGIGGSCASMGMKARGKVDAELAYLIMEKKDVFRGGLEDAEKICEGAREAFLEGVLKDLNSLRVSLDCKRVVLSGKNACELKKELELRGSEFEFEELRIRGCERMALNGNGESKQELEFERDASGSGLVGFEEFEIEKNVKAAAFGAALVADGLAGGRMKRLVEAMRLKEAKGSVFDFIC